VQGPPGRPHGTQGLRRALYPGAWTYSTDLAGLRRRPIAQLVKTLYEHHFRTVLAKRGKLSRSATEWVCDSLFDILKEKVEEGGLAVLELEVCVVALRRL
jgi:hypothetical protein